MKLAILQSLKAVRSWAISLIKIIMNKTGIFYSRSKPTVRELFRCYNLILNETGIFASTDNLQKLILVSVRNYSKPWKITRQSNLGENSFTQFSYTLSLQYLCIMIQSSNMHKLNIKIIIFTFYIKSHSVWFLWYLEFPSLISFILILISPALIGQNIHHTRSWTM